MPTESVDIPGARPPDRQGRVDAHGVRLALYEWGDPEAPPLALVHGGFDFARTFDVFAPLLADAGWRAIAWDQRGHGDSEHAELYSWGTDVRDALAVLDRVAPEPLPVLGHSKGGSLMLDLASSFPERITRVVNLDGLPSRRNWPDVPDHQRTKLLAGELANWLDHRRSTVDAVRKPGTIAELAARRGRMNSRLSTEWLQYLVTVGAREDEDGWRWKIDPTLRLGGFGPWRPEWALDRLSLLGMPVLALLGPEPETMGWGTRVEDVRPHLPPAGQVFELDGVGHFVHIEQPERVARMVLDFLGRPAGEPATPAPARHDDPPVVPAARWDAPATTGPPVVLRHNRVDLALHRLRADPDGTEGPDRAPGAERDGRDGRARWDGPAGGGSGAARPLLLLHGLGQRSPRRVPHHLESWPGPVWALDLTGHGASSRPRGGGYFAEVLMGDADTALAHLGPVTVYGWGLGAYVALLIAGARPELVRGAILDDGPGLHGGGPKPISSFLLDEPFGPGDGDCDPYARLELSRDVRPDDYAATFARQAATLSGLEVAVAVVGAVRPSWLEAVEREPGVQVTSRERALGLFAG